MIKTYTSEIPQGKIKVVVRNFDWKKGRSRKVNKQMEEIKLEGLPIEEEIRSDKNLGEDETPTPEEEASVAPKTEEEKEEGSGTQAEPATEEEGAA